MLNYQGDKTKRNGVKQPVQKGRLEILVGCSSVCRRAGKIETNVHRATYVPWSNMVLVIRTRMGILTKGIPINGLLTIPQDWVYHSTFNHGTDVCNCYYEIIERPEGL